MENLAWRSKKACLLLIPVFFHFCLFQKAPIQVYLIGGSTMSSFTEELSPLTGWGMPFAHFFDSSVTIRNEARSGVSTRTFIEENRWQPIADSLKPGDYVLIHFGHNDEVPTKKSYTTKEAFRANLIRFIRDTRAKDANPLLFTPVARRRFDDSGRVVETHGEYSAIVLGVAREYKVPCIDLNKKSQDLYQSLGPERSKFLFNYLTPGENPHYPKGNVDDTHFNELGARKIAELVLTEIRNMKLELAERIFKPEQ